VLGPSPVVELAALESLGPVLVLLSLGAVDAGADEPADESELAGVLLCAGALGVSAGALLVSAGALLVSAGALLVSAGALLVSAGAALVLGVALAAGAGCGSGVAGAAAAAAGVCADAGAGASGVEAAASRLGAEVAAEAAASPEDEPLAGALAGLDECVADELVSLTRTVLAWVGVERAAEARSTAVFTVAALAVFVPHARPEECCPSRLLISDSIREPAPIEPGG